MSALCGRVPCLTVTFHCSVPCCCWPGAAWGALEGSFLRGALQRRGKPRARAALEHRQGPGEGTFRGDARDLGHGLRGTVWLAGEFVPVWAKGLSWCLRSLSRRGADAGLCAQCSVLCRVLRLPWTLSVPLGEDRSLRRERLWAKQGAPLSETRDLQHLQMLVWEAQKVRPARGGPAGLRVHDTPGSDPPASAGGGPVSSWWVHPSPWGLQGVAVPG